MTLAIADIDSLSIIFERRSKFHVLEPYTIRSATFKGSQSILGSQGFSLKFAIHWIHGSFQKSIASPLLTTKQAPFRITHFSFSIAFHIGEAFLRGSWPNQSSFTLYLLLRASRHKPSKHLCRLILGTCSRRHCFMIWKFPMGTCSGLYSKISLI